MATSETRNQTIQDARDRVDDCRSGFLTVKPTYEFLAQFRQELIEVVKAIDEALERGEFKNTNDVRVDTWW